MRKLTLVMNCGVLLCLLPAWTADDSEPTRTGSGRDVGMLEYASASRTLESLLVQEEDREGQRLTGVTRLRDGTRLWEEARFDANGRLVHAESMRSCPSGQSETVVFDPKAGIVEVRAAAAQGTRRWSVPTDHPWIWVPQSCSSRSATMTTPVSALVALRAASGVRRLIDPSGLSSHTIMSDQVIVREDDRAAWVVLGEDAMLVRDGLPTLWRCTALGEDVTRR